MCALHVHCACNACALRVHCVRTVRVRNQLASQPLTAPPPPPPPQPLTGLTASRSPVSPLQAVSIELRNQPAFCREEDMDVLVEVPSLGRVPNPNPNPNPNPYPNS